MTKELEFRVIEEAVGGVALDSAVLIYRGANSTAFARCQVEKVFRNVCLRSPVDGTDRTQIDSMVSSFRSGGYRLKQVFAESAAYCMGD